MAAAVSTFHRTAFILITAACLAAVSCADRDSPTSPASSSNGGKATISGTLLAGTDASPAAAAQPLAGAAVRVASTGQTARTDEAGNFTLAGLSPGAVALEIRGAGIQASTTVNAAAGIITRVTVTVNRGHGTVSLTPRSNEIEGTIDSINVAGRSFVLNSPRGMLVVQTDAATVLRLRGSPVGFGDLKAGQTVEVEGSLQPDGTLLARKVTIENPEETRTPTPSPTATTTPPTATPTSTVTTTPATATPTRTPRPREVELEGTVGAISGTSFALITRSGPVTIQTDSATRFQKDGDASFADITTGGRVEVRGTQQGDGSVLASRVKIEGDNEGDGRTRTTTPQATRTPEPTRTPEAEGAELEGTVGNISGTSFVLLTRSGPVTIQTNAATQFRDGGDPKTFADIKAGAEVQVKGTSQPDGSILASRVSLRGK